MTSPRRAAGFAVLALATALVATACAPAPAFAPASLEEFRGEDHLLHDRDVIGMAGEPLPEGSTVEGLATTAAGLRLLQTSGFEPALTASTAAGLDEAAEEATAAGELDAVVGAARVCALAARTSDPCMDVRAAATAWLDRPAEDALGEALPVALVDAAADLGVREPASGSVLEAALASTSDSCGQSAVVRYRVRMDAPVALARVADPRARTERVLGALRDGDIDRALCLSGVVAATAGATPERDEDWLQGPFDEAVAAGFERSDEGMYSARDRSRGRIETTRMLSQVSFDLSAELR